MLRVQGLEHRFGNRVVLEDFSVAVPRGSVFGLLGPNGSGKSTVLRILCGLLRADRGELELAGTRADWGGRSLRACMGVVFQEESLDDRLSVRENLELMLGLYGVRGRPARERTHELLDLVGLRDRELDRAGTLSGGMRRSLEIARALAHRPQILLLDEPTSGLDERAYKRVWEHLDGLRARDSLTVLMTTHRPDEAERCDRLAILHHGKIREEGTPAELKARLSGDILTLEGDDSNDLAQRIKDRFQITARVVGAQVMVEAKEGHILIPRLVEGLGPGALRSVSMRKPSLADVFSLSTGEALASQQNGGAS